MKYLNKIYEYIYLLEYVIDEKYWISISWPRFFSLITFSFSMIIGVILLLLFVFAIKVLELIIDVEVSPFIKGIFWILSIVFSVLSTIYSWFFTSKIRDKASLRVQELNPKMTFFKFVLTQIAYVIISLTGLLSFCFLLVGGFLFRL
tara:strand:+ start:67 stop:507 length:441 start_codon:yes stop_codon:yes gene_type:complete